MEFKVGMRVTVKDKGYAGTIRWARNGHHSTEIAHSLYITMYKTM